MNRNVLPVTNENGYFEIRLESIGGLGANLCGKMLGELGALSLSLNSLSFSSYGSEKRGSPVKAYIRWCAEDKPLRINSPVTHPHILGIFHEGLIGTHPVLEGVSTGTKIILNTPYTADAAAEKYGISIGELYCLDALSIAMECKSRVNMVMLGAIAKASGFIPADVVEQLCRDTVGQKYPALIEANLSGLREGYARAEKATVEQNRRLQENAKVISGVIKMPRSAASTRAREARSPTTFPRPGRDIYRFLYRTAALTAASATPPVRIWYSSLPRAFTKIRNAW